MCFKQKMEKGQMLQCNYQSSDLMFVNNTLRFKYYTLILDWDPGTRRIPSESTPFFSKNDNNWRKERKNIRRVRHQQIWIPHPPLLVILIYCCDIQGVVKATQRTLRRDQELYLKRLAAKVIKGGKEMLKMWSRGQNVILCWIKRLDFRLTHDIYADWPESSSHFMHDKS